MSHNLLVLSDVHLGSDLVQHVRPEAVPEPSTDHRDQQLVSLLDWYREHPRRGRPWRLVIAGDLVDFVGMSVSAPSAHVGTPLDADERLLGLGTAEDHAIHKLRYVARRHRTIFEALFRFIGAGNTVVIVRGNHDLDFHWPAVQDEFVRQLNLYGPIPRGCLEFCPWFYYERGRVYVEHGHQYDRYCSYDNVLYPVSPEDTRRSSASLSDVLLRYVVKPTRGLGQTGHESASFLDYVRFAVRLGSAGMVALALRFARAVSRLFRIWNEHASERARSIREHHDRKMAELAQRLDVGLDALRALSLLQRPPVTRSFVSLLSTVMLDRVLMAVVTALFVVLLGLLASPKIAAYSVFIAISAMGGFNFWLSRVRRDIEPSAELRDRAPALARLFPAAFIVMGHTHVPEVKPVLREPTTYVNLGSWEGSEVDHTSPSRTHLVVEDHEDGSTRAELCVWDALSGPRRYFPEVQAGEGAERAEAGMESSS